MIFWSTYSLIIKYTAVIAIYKIITLGQSSYAWRSSICASQLTGVKVAAVNLSQQVSTSCTFSDVLLFIAYYFSDLLQTIQGAQLWTITSWPHFYAERCQVKRSFDGCWLAGLPTVATECTSVYSEITFPGSVNLNFVDCGRNYKSYCKSCERKRVLFERTGVYLLLGL